MGNGNGGFNSLDVVENLQEAGLPEKQAKILVRALSQVADHSAATKQDLEVAKIELQRDIKVLETNLTNKMITVVGVGIGFISFLMIFLNFWQKSN